MTTKKQVAKKAETAVTMWEPGGETGFEGTSGDDYSVPFINLLQKNSPQVDEDAGGYVAGAKAGMFLNVTTGEVSDSFEFIACHYHRAMVEWRERDEGGGFVAQHPVGYEAQFEKDDRGRWKASAETHLVDTRYFFGLGRMGDGEFDAAVLSFSSTQTKKAKNWMTRMQSIKATGAGGQRFTLPMFASIFNITSVGESKDEFNWKGYKIELAGQIEDAFLAQAAKDARDMFRASADQFKPPAQEGGGDAPAGGGGKPPADDGDIPF